MESHLFDLLSAGFGALASLLLGLMLREQISLRRRVTHIERESVKAAVYLGILCERAQVPFVNVPGE
jgi:hypothetical protein